eukprot:TRINITY_DN90825_c0_g1_i2.p1 TRINITY_DN90825_c0_g1~~TRINITY_DN90825_c0_g1_i2.p1  ORF type:complete len:347 (+),score=6.91 TRINITY_DN90825_c0_g1_i2:115-1155(+)
MNQEQQYQYQNWSLTQLVIFVLLSSSISGSASRGLAQVSQEEFLKAKTNVCGYDFIHLSCNEGLLLEQSAQPYLSTSYTSPDLWPFHVSFQLPTHTPGCFKHICQGVIISGTKVMTSGSCAWSLLYPSPVNSTPTPNNVYISHGPLCRNDAGYDRIRTTKTEFVFESEDDRDYDVVVFHLEREVRFDWLGPIKSYPQVIEQQSSHRRGWNVGWFDSYFIKNPRFFGPTITKIKKTPTQRLTPGRTHPNIPPLKKTTIQLINKRTPTYQYLPLHRRPQVFLPVTNLKLTPILQHKTKLNHINYQYVVVLHMGVLVNRNGILARSCTRGVRIQTMIRTVLGVMSKKIV